MIVFLSLTKAGAPHEIVSGILGVIDMLVTSLGVKLGELVSMEAVVVLHEAEGRGATWQVLQILRSYLLCLDIVVVHVISFRESEVDLKFILHADNSPCTMKVLELHHVKAHKHISVP